MKRFLIFQLAAFQWVGAVLGTYPIARINHQYHLWVTRPALSMRNAIPHYNTHHGYDRRMRKYQDTITHTLETEEIDLVITHTFRNRSD